MKFILSLHCNINKCTCWQPIWTNFSFSFQPSDNIVPVSIVEKGFRSRTLHSGDIDSVGGSIVSDQDGSEAHGNFLSPPKSAKSNDDSLTYSEDSDTTRIYNLNTRETKIVLPAGEDQVDSPIESPVKIGQQFFRGSPKKVTEIRRMDDEVRTVIRTSSRNGDDGSVSCNVSCRCDNSIRLNCRHSGAPRGARSLRREASDWTGSHR